MSDIWLPRPADRGLLHSRSFDQLGFATAAGAAASAAWDSASRAIAVPFAVSRRVLVTKLFVYNGATASGNLDVGIYNAEWGLLVSAGSTAQAGTNVNQVIDVTDTWLKPGLHWLALVMDGTTGTVFRNSLGSTRLARAAGLATMAAAFPLPATFTPAASATILLPWCGALLRRTTL